MRNHIKRFYPEEEENQSVVVASTQQILGQSISNFPPNSEHKLYCNPNTLFVWELLFVLFSCDINML